jgi:hypothetical protein
MASIPVTGDSAPILLRAMTSPRLQAKLTVNTPGDKYEQEADRVAEAVMRVPDASPFAMGRAPASTVDSPTLPTSEARDILAEAGPGHPMPAEVRHDFERRFHHDFSQIRVHAGAAAARSAASFQARAYALGSHLVFGAGQYQVSSDEGRRLLAHELCHTVQQAEGCHIRRQDGSGVPKGHIDLPIDPKKPQEFLRRLSDYVQQQIANEQKRGGVTHPGHVKKLEDTLRQVKKLERRGGISKKIARAARRIAKKAGPIAAIAISLWPEDALTAEHDPTLPGSAPPEKDWLDTVLDFLDEIDPFHVKPAY